MNKSFAKISFLIAILLAVFSFEGMAQNLNPNNLSRSPYTRYGYGKLGSVGNAETRAMGDAGIAVFSSSFTNLYNPAGITAIDSVNMIMDVGLNAEWCHASENGAGESNWNAGFNYMSFQVPLWRHWAAALSLTPYSLVGYEYGAETEVPIDNALIKNDTLKYSNSYSGDGGIQKTMFTLGWSPIVTKKTRLNLGASIGYLFGTVSHAGSIEISSSQGQSTYITRAYTANGYELNFGLQYLFNVSADHKICIGGTFSPETRINVHAENTKISNTDTLFVEDDLKLSTPKKFGAGISYMVGQKMTATAEFSMEKWGNIAGLNANLQKTDGIYKNITKFAAGIEYQPKVWAQSYFKTCRYRAGLNVKNSYIETYGSQNKEYTISAGMGLPVGATAMRKKSLLNLTIEYTHVNPSKSGLLKENYLNLTLGLTYNEWMFFRNKLR